LNKHITTKPPAPEGNAALQMEQRSLFVLVQESNPLFLEVSSSSLSLSLIASSQAHLWDLPPSLLKNNCWKLPWVKKKSLIMWNQCI